VRARIDRSSCSKMTDRGAGDDGEDATSDASREFGKTDLQAMQVGQELPSELKTLVVSRLVFFTWMPLFG